MWGVQLENFRLVVIADLDLAYCLWFETFLKKQCTTGHAWSNLQYATIYISDWGIVCGNIRHCQDETSVICVVLCGGDLILGFSSE